MTKSENKILTKIRTLLITLLFTINLVAQTPNSVGIGTTAPNNSAVLHLESSNQGFLMTRLTTTQISSITTPTVGLIIYNTSDQCFWYKRPTYWARLCNTDSINANSVITNTFHADTTFINVNNFGNGIGDSIWVHYASIDTAIINNLTVHTINADSIFLGGNSITTVITDSINSLAWLLKGNTGTNPLINFIGTKDAQPLVIRTNNIENIRVLPTGETGFGTPSPTAKVEIIGNTKSTNLQMTSGAANGLILQSDAVGSGSWTPASAIVSVLTPTVFNTNAWTLLGNSVTTPSINFLGTTDNQPLVIRTNNTEKIRLLPTGELGVGTNSPNAKLEVIGNTKTTNFQMTTLPTNNFILKSDAAGNGSWVNIASVLTSTAINGSGWTILGNTGTNPTINFAGTIDNQDFVIRTNNVEKVRVEATGDVGIGVINATAKLDVNGNTKTVNFQMTTAPTNSFILQTDAAGNGTWVDPSTVVSVLTPTVFNSNAWTLLGNTGTVPGVNFIGTTDGRDLAFRTVNLERMKIFQNGRVGINLTSASPNVPLSQLDVNGQITLRLGAQPNYILKSTNTFGISSWVDISTLLTTTALNGSSWTILGNSGTNPAINFAGTTDNQDFVLRTNNTEKARLLSTGEFGIGVAIPDKMLTVVAPGTNRQVAKFSDASRYIGLGRDEVAAYDVSTGLWADMFLGGGNKVSILTNGNVGIGYTTPGSKLDVNGNTKTINFQMTTGATNTYLMQSDAAGNGSWINPATLITPTTLNNSAWTILGNSGTNPATNFIGTTDNQDFAVRVNNGIKFYFTKNNELLAPPATIAYRPQYGFFTGAGVANSYGLYFYNNEVGISRAGTPTIYVDGGNNVHSRFLGPYTVGAGAINNSLNGTGTIGAGSAQNVIFGSNTLGPNSVSNVVLTAVGSPASVVNGASNLVLGSYGNNITSPSTNQNHIFGRFNTVGSTAGYNFIIGANNNAMATSQQCYLFGNGIANSKTQMIGIGLGAGFDYGAWGGFDFITLAAGGGTRIFSNPMGTSGVALASGGGAWASISDRKMKENITDISPKTILEKIITVPVTEWTYITQKVDSMNKYAPSGIHYDKAPVHIGPMAQDFAEIFGYGEFKDKITTTDIDGVMFAAIQALAIENKELKSKLEKTAQEMEELKRLVNEIKNH